MADKKFTEHDLETHERLARIEERMDTLIEEVCGFKKNFWRIFTPSIGFLSTAISGLIAAVTTKFFHHN